MLDWMNGRVVLPTMSNASFFVHPICVVCWVNCVHSVLSQSSFAIAQSQLLSTSFREWVKHVLYEQFVKVSIVRSQVHPTKRIGVNLFETLSVATWLFSWNSQAEFMFACAVRNIFIANKSLFWALFLTQPTTIFKASLRCSDAIWKLYGID